MPTLSIAELVEATGGHLISGDPTARVDSYRIDTRKIGPGGVFFALAGTRTDGHRFVGEAAHNGAAAAVVSRTPDEGQDAPPAIILVNDTAAALGLCGTWVRRRLDDVHWLAVTGSNGKTTTKEMLAEGLSAGASVHRTAGNLNNHLGVPLTLLATPDDSRFAVIEEAMSGAGEIAELTQMTDPDIGLVTNVRAAHMKFFQSLDDVAAAKGEMFAAMRSDAVSVVNLDDPHVRVQATRHDGPRVTFGQHPAADVRLESYEDHILPGTALRFRHDNRSRELQLRICGAHSAFNAVAALAGVVAAGQDVDAAAEKIAQLEPVPGRGSVHRLDRDILLIDDSYNSSPAALSMMLDSLKLAEPAGRRVLVMGDMLELGDLEGALHREAGKRAGAAGVQLLIAVGSLSRGAAEAARRAGVPEVYHHKDSAAAAEAIGDFLRDGDLVVVKGSRGVRLGRVVRALTGERREGGG